MLFNVEPEMRQLVHAKSKASNAGEGGAGEGGAGSSGDGGGGGGGDEVSAGAQAGVSQ